MSSHILVLNGPNLNMLGVREPEIYGHETLADIEAMTRTHGEKQGLAITFRQSNGEGELVGWVQQAHRDYGALIVNAGAYTHTSVALLDALLSCRIPVIEVHLSNIHQREEFRHHSYVSRAAVGIIAGFGAFGYLMAVDAIAHILNNE